VAGVLAAAIAYSLREAGFLTGFLAVAVAVLCVVCVPGPRRVAERLLLVFALALGWLPLLGWLPGLGNAIDVPGMILAVGVGVACWHQLRPNRTSPRIVSLPTLPEWLALGAWLFVTTWWWLPLHRFSRTGLLSALFIGWDNNTHFSMFRSNLILGSFIQVRPTLPGGLTRLGADYPQGVHQAWAQFTRLLHPHPSSDLAWLLHAYVDVLVLTAAGIVLVGCLAVCRLARRDLLAALPAMALVVALFGLGRFGPFNGFPNFELAVMASAVAISLVIRPSMRPLVNFVAVAGMGLIVVYNWYPLFVLIAPAASVTALRARRATDRHRVAVTAFLVVTGIAYVLPAVSFLHRGITWLNVAGAGVKPSWGLLIAGAATLVAVAVVRQALRPDLATNLSVGAPGILGGGAVLAVCLYEVASTGAISYYGFKLATGVLGVCVTVLACVYAADVSTARSNTRLRAPIVVTAAVLVALALPQVDTWDAQGLTIHQYIANAQSGKIYSRPLLLAAMRSRAISIATSGQPCEGRWSYLDPTRNLTDDPFYPKMSQLAQWFVVLCGDPSNNEIFYPIGSLGVRLNDATSRATIARLLVHGFPDPEAGDVHLFVPAWLKAAIIAQDARWGRPGHLLDSG
jgi:hypothetical protein